MEYLNLILACQKVIWGISSCYRLCQSWLIQQTSTLVVARRRLHPSHYFSMEVHNTVRSHVFLLPDTSIQGFHEILWCCHPISWHQSVHKISHGITLLRDCIRNIVSSPGRLLSEGMYTKLADDYCQGDSPEELLSNWSHLLETPRDCSLCLSATNQHLSCLGFCPKVYSQVVPIVLLHSLAALLPESVKGLTFFISACKVLSHVLPYSAVTPIQPTLDCD